MAFNDYPKAVRDNAQRGIDLNKKQGNKCATQVGKVRAQQLAKGEKISEATLLRMYRYLARHEVYYKPNDTEACGTISYLLWGGLAGKRWATSKIEELQLADIGPRGGIRPSKKAPKSDTPGDGKKGSTKNKPGSAKDSRGKVKIPASVEKSLQKKSDDFNERYKGKLGYGVTIGKLRAVYQRGVGAFQTSHSPNVSSAEQWGQARVNAFLYLVKNGRPQNAKYTGDNDLLPKGHPKNPK